MKNKIYLWILVISLVFSACSKDQNPDKENLTISDFENNLKSEMNYEAIVSIFGEPPKDIGSGIHIYVYQLKDLTEVWIGYTNQILYARHMDQNHNLLEALI